MDFEDFLMLLATAGGGAIGATLVYIAILLFT